MALCINLGTAKKVHKLPYNATPNMILVGLKLFQDAITGSVSDKATRLNFFLQQTEIRCQQFLYFINDFEYRAKNGHTGTSISETAGSYQNHKQ